MLKLRVVQSEHCFEVLYAGANLISLFFKLISLDSLLKSQSYTTITVLCISDFGAWRIAWKLYALTEIYF